MNLQFLTHFDPPSTQDLLLGDELSLAKEPTGNFVPWFPLEMDTEWRCPKLGVPLNHSFLRDFPLQTISGTPMTMETPKCY